MQKVILTILFLLLARELRALQELTGWEIGPFERVERVNPIISPRNTPFFCPIQGKEVTWESDHTFNPGTVIRNGKIYLFYRAEDNYGQGIGAHTSRLGLATSKSGLYFNRFRTPVLFPKQDDQYEFEWPGGCEDPRIVEAEDGTYVMTYTQWNQKIAVLAIATSENLFEWKKQGYAFSKAHAETERLWSKSGSIVCRRENDRLIATKIQGKYWMYWGEGMIYIATSDDLISWEPVLDTEGNLLVLLRPRPGKFDSALVEPGPPAILTNKGIVFLYNGKNAGKTGDASLPKGAYAAGQLLIDCNNPCQVLARTENCFFKPEKPYETKGQYEGGTVFIQGLVHFHNKWFLYYGCADSLIGVAIAEDHVD